MTQVLATPSEVERWYDGNRGEECKDTTSDLSDVSPTISLISRLTVHSHSFIGGRYVTRSYHSSHKMSHRTSAMILRIYHRQATFFPNVAGFQCGPSKSFPYPGERERGANPSEAQKWSTICVRRGTIPFRTNTEVAFGTIPIAREDTDWSGNHYPAHPKHMNWE